jgi:hypothetical protein
MSKHCFGEAAVAESTVMYNTLYHHRTLRVEKVKQNYPVGDRMHSRAEFVNLLRSQGIDFQPRGPF